MNEPGFVANGFQNDVTGQYKGFQVGSFAPSNVISTDALPRRRREDEWDEIQRLDDEFNLLLS